MCRRLSRRCVHEHYTGTRVVEIVKNLKKSLIEISGELLSSVQRG